MASHIPQTARLSPRQVAAFLLARVAFLIVLAFGLMTPMHGEDWACTNAPPGLRGDPRALASDAAGNRYILGGFRDSYDFAPLPGVIDQKTATGGGSDIYVTRINADGSYAWTQTIGGSNEEGFGWVYVEGSFGSIVVDNGVVYVWSRMAGDDVMVGSAGPIVNPGGAVVIALSADTGVLYTAFGSSGVVPVKSSSWSLASAIVSHNGILYALGDFSGNDLGIGGLGTVAAPSTRASFIAAINAVSGLAVTSFGNGGLQIIGDEASASCSAITVTDDGVFVTGGFIGAQLGIGGLGSFSAANGKTTFIASLNMDGSAHLAFGTDGLQSAGGDDFETSSGIAVTSSAIYVAGMFSGNGLGIGAPAGSINAVESDGFLLGLSRTSGSPLSGFGTQGVVRIGGAGYEFCRGVALAGNQKLAVIGTVLSADGLGIDGLGSGQTLGSNQNGFVGVYSSVTGVAETSFGGTGYRTIASFARAVPRGITVHDGILNVVISTSGGDGVVDGWGRLNAGFDYNTQSLLLSWFLTNGSAVRSQAITMAPIQARILGAADFMPTVTADPASGNPVTLTTTNPAVATVAGMTVTVEGLGTCDIVAVQAAGNGRAAATAGQTLTVIADGISPQPEVQVRSVDGMAVDSDGNRYLAHTFIGSVDHHPLAGSGDVLQYTPGFYTSAITRINADGSYGWSQIITSSFGVSFAGIAVENGVVYVAGLTYSADVAIGAPSSLPLWAIGRGDVVIAALSSVNGAARTAFGRNGIQRIGDEFYNMTVNDLVVQGDRIFVTGIFFGNELGIGARGTFSSSGVNNNIYIACLNRLTGASVSEFGTHGLQRICGADTLTPTSITATNDAIYVTGSFTGTTLGIESPGTTVATGNPGGFVAALARSSGQALGTFGSAGILTISNSTIHGAAVDGGSLFLLGFGGGDVAVGGSPDVTPTTSPGFVAAVSRASGAPIAAFGQTGVVGFGSSTLSAVGPRDITALGGKVIFTGTFFGDNFGIGSPGTVNSIPNNATAFIGVIDGTTGAADTTFSDDGIEVVGPGEGVAVARSSTQVYAAGNILNVTPGEIAGLSTWDISGGWYGYVLAVNPTEATAGPATAWPGAGNGSGSDSSGGSSGCGNGAQGFAVFLLLFAGLRWRTMTAGAGNTRRGKR